MGTSRIGHGRVWRMTLMALAFLFCGGIVSGCCRWWPAQRQSNRITAKRPSIDTPAATPPTSVPAPKVPEVPGKLETPRVAEPQPTPPKPPKPLSRRQQKRLQALGVLFFRDVPSHEIPPVTVQGWLSGPPGDQRLRLRLTNRTSSLIQMSSIADRYVIETTAGRLVALSKEEFLRYPSALFPADEHDVILRLPADLSANTISRLTITLNVGNTTVALVPLGTPAAAAKSLSSAGR